MQWRAQNAANAKLQMTPNVCRSSVELRPNSHMLPSRTEPNIRPNSSAELRHLPNFGPSLVLTTVRLVHFLAKGGFVMQNFQNLTANGSRGDHFWTKLPKSTSLADIMCFEPSPLRMQIRSRVFSLGVPTKRKGHYKKSQRGCISLICRNSPLKQI